MTITQHEATFLVLAIVPGVWWWLGRRKAKQQRTGRISPQHQDLLVRFRDVIIEERARERVLK